MDSLKDLLSGIEKEPVDPNTVADDEYLEDGEIHCKNCNTPRTERLWKTPRRISCDCQLEAKRIYEASSEYQRILAEQQAEAEKRDRQERTQKINEKKEGAGISLRYRDASFENTTSEEESFEAARNACMKYTTAYAAQSQGIGLFLFGQKGTGKTRLAACIANTLIEQGKSVIFTSFGEIDKHIKDTFSSNESELQYMATLESANYLFIDDFGTEKVTTVTGSDRMLQEKVYDIVNSRYNALRPIIYTSNHSLQELGNMGVASKTLDRIMEVSEFFKLDGESKRREIYRERRG